MRKTRWLASLVLVLVFVLMTSTKSYAATGSWNLRHIKGAPTSENIYRQTNRVSAESSQIGATAVSITDGLLVTYRFDKKEPEIFGKPRLSYVYNVTPRSKHVLIFYLCSPSYEHMTCYANGNFYY